MEFESSNASHRVTPVFVGIWIIRDLQNFSNYSKDVGFFSIFGGHWSPDQWEDPVNYIYRNQAVSCSPPSFVQFYSGDLPGQSETDSLFTSHHFTQLYNYILAIHRDDPKQTPCSPVTFSRRFTLFAFQRIKKPCFFRGVNIYPPRKNACKLNEWQAARLTSPFDFNFFRRWAFPPQNIYRRKDIFLCINLFIKAV